MDYPPPVPIGTPFLIMHNIKHPRTIYLMRHWRSHEKWDIIGFPGITDYTYFSIGTFEGIIDIDITKEDSDEIIETIRYIPKFRLLPYYPPGPGTILYGYKCTWFPLDREIKEMFDTLPHQHKYFPPSTKQIASWRDVLFPDNTPSQTIPDLIKSGISKIFGRTGGSAP